MTGWHRRLAEAGAKALDVLRTRPRRLVDFGTLSLFRFLDMATGLLKDIVLTRSFGLGAFLDAYFVTVAYFDLVSGFFQQLGYGILLPFYNDQAHAKDSHEPQAPAVKQRQERLILAFFNYTTLGILLLAGVVALFHREIAHLIAPKLHTRHPEPLELLLLVSLPLGILFQSSNALRLLLIQEKRFVWFHLPGIAATVLFTGLVFALYPDYGYQAVVWALPASFLLQFALYWHSLGLRWQPVWHVPEIGRMFRYSLPNLFIWLFFYLFLPVDNFFLSYAPAGDVGAFRYGAKLVSNVGLLTVFSLQTTLVPALMQAGSRRDWPDIRRLMGKGLLESFLWSLPLIALLYWLAPMLVRLLFERGAFGPEDTERTVFFMRIVLFQLPCLGAWMMVSRSLNSLYLLRPFLLLGLAMLALKVLIDWVTLRWLGIEAFAWGMTLHYYVMLAAGLIVLLYSVRRLSRE